MGLIAEGKLDTEPLITHTYPLAKIYSNVSIIIVTATGEKKGKMVNINDYHEERSCVYKDEEYLVRDNGAVLRKSRPNQRVRKLDNEWTFGKTNIKTG